MQQPKDYADKDEQHLLYEEATLKDKLIQLAYTILRHPLRSSYKIARSLWKSLYYTLKGKLRWLYYKLRILWITHV